MHSGGQFNPNPINIKTATAFKGDTAAIILDGVKIVPIKISRTFLSIESENVWPSAMATFAVFYVETDDQVRRLGKHKLHNNNKVIRKALSIY
jgi:hypothetical protein